MLGSNAPTTELERETTSSLFLEESGRVEIRSFSLRDKVESERNYGFPDTERRVLVFWSIGATAGGNRAALRAGTPQENPMQEFIDVLFSILGLAETQAEATPSVLPGG